MHKFSFSFKNAHAMVRSTLVDVEERVAVERADAQVVVGEEEEQRGPPERGLTRLEQHAPDVALAHTRDLTPSHTHTVTRNELSGIATRMKFQHINKLININIHMHINMWRALVVEFEGAHVVRVLYELH